MISLKDYLVSVFGEDNVTEEPVPRINMPLFYTYYTYESFKIFGQQYIFIHWTDLMTLEEYSHRRLFFEERFGLPVVMVLQKSYARQIKQFIERRIMFVEPGRQIYMPWSGIVLKKARKTMPPDPIAKFTPQMQVCALYFLYEPEPEHPAKDIMARTGLNSSAVNRALRVLVDIGALTAKPKGSARVYAFAQDKPAFYQCIESCLFNPVAKTVIVKEDDLSGHSVYADYTALCEWYDLMDIDRTTYAVSRKGFNGMNLNADPDNGMLIYDKSYVKLQVWEYDPALFADEPGYADKVSVWLSIPDRDVRTEYAIYDVMDEIIGWHPPDDEDC